MPTEQQLQVAQRIPTFSHGLGPRIETAAQPYYDEHSDYGWALMTSIDGTRLLQHIQLEAVVVPRLGRTTHEWWFLMGLCDWEQEHGIEILLDGPKVVSIGPNDCLFLNEAWEHYITT